MHVLSKEFKEVHLFYPKPVQIIINIIKPPCVFSAHNDVTYFRRLGEFDKGRSICFL